MCHKPQKQSSNPPTLDTEKPREGVQALRDWAREHVSGRLAWYAKAKYWKKWGSWAMRLASLCFAALGGLCPLIDAISINGDHPLLCIKLTPIGYVFIAIAAGLPLFDRMMGASTGWMRYILAQLHLERLRYEFECDWLVLQQQYPVPQTAPDFSFTPYVERAKRLIHDTEEVVQQETDSWVREFQATISELETVLQNQAKERKPGAIRVAVAGSDAFDAVEISLQGAEARNIGKQSEALLQNIVPGNHEIHVIGKKKDAADMVQSKVVTVGAGQLASVDIKFA